MTVVNSIVAGNTSDVVEENRSAAAVRADDCDFTVGTLGGNLEGSETCGFRGLNDKQNTDPKLAALAANGGATKTHALAADSPAVNMALAGKCLATDQRGIARPEMCLVSDAREVYSERRPPPSCSEYRDVTNDRSPLRARHIRSYGRRMRRPYTVSVTPR